jgi:hypothetical protein
MPTLPNFFILGAPKCGTTALAQYLQGHNRILISNPKEPCFFNIDHSFPRWVTDFASYLSCFDDADNQHLAIGDASVQYLSSRVAVSEILQVIPDARFVICLRNPVDMARSVHGELFRAGYETVSDFRQAWSLQKFRRLHPPRTIIDGHWLQYRLVCSIGTQLGRVFELVPKNRVLLVFLDDMREDPARIYDEVLQFLNVPTDGRTYFPIVNEYGGRRSLWLTLLLRAARRFRHHAGLRSTLFNSTVFGRLNRVPMIPPIMDSEFRRELGALFAQEVELLEKLTKRDLSDWKRQNMLE